MQQHHYLIADDVDEVKIGRIRSSIECADPMAEIHIARSVREALALTDAVEFDAAAIDFDFLGEAENGADIIRTLRGKNAQAAIALVTARDEEAYEEASARALDAGANATFTSATSFESELQTTLAA
ncbi:MAG: hypothetical protein WCV62_02690 [Candidatus Peribacteraceae bacterium]|jgi:DNA-binding response OmpR family regulator